MNSNRKSDVIYDVGTDSEMMISIIAAWHMLTGCWLMKNG